MPRKRIEAMGLNESSKIAEAEKKGFFASLGKTERIFAIGIAALLAVSVFGAAGSRMGLFNSSAPTSQSQTASSSQGITQNSANPSALANPSSSPSATPQLSKEYIYAGSRMLAVEDANANATPPADLAVWRKSTGMWYVLGGPGSAQASFQWGATGDTPVPGDYDGDGKTDFSIYRHASGTWWVVKSSDNSYYSLQFGAGCTNADPLTCDDKVAQADYDGDGKTDAAVFRSSNGTWYWLNSGNGNSFSQQQFGLSTDTPAPADYDGDGKADIGVLRGSTFYSSNSSNGQLGTATFTQAATKPVSGDYDGDGRADYAIRSGNDWIYKKSSDNTIETVTWELGSDEAVQNDYDGDGKVDIAVWRPGNGTWYIRQSGLNNSLRQVQWGAAGDIPVPAYYRR